MSKYEVKLLDVNYIRYVATVVVEATNEDEAIEEAQTKVEAMSSDVEWSGGDEIEAGDRPEFISIVEIKE